MDDNTKDVFFLALPILNSLVLAWIAYKMAIIKASIEAASVRANLLGESVRAVAANVEKVEKATNSQMTLLVAATKAASIAEGRAEEKNERGIRDSERARGAFLERDRAATAAQLQPVVVGVATATGPECLLKKDKHEM
jgi:hypothetical protein